MYKINVTSSFSAAHKLNGYEGACKNLHGHNWKVRAGINCTKTDEIGLSIDFGIVKKHLNELMENLDHKCLNDIEPFTKNNPTSENISKWLFDELSTRLNSETATVCEIEVWESEKSSIIYYKG